MKSTAKELEEVKEKLEKIQQNLKKEGSVRAEMAVQRLSMANDTIIRVQTILTRQF